MHRAPIFALKSTNVVGFNSVKVKTRLQGTRSGIRVVIIKKGNFRRCLENSKSLFGLIGSTDGTEYKDSSLRQTVRK